MNLNNCFSKNKMFANESIHIAFLLSVVCVQVVVTPHG